MNQLEYDLNSLNTSPFEPQSAVAAFDHILIHPKLAHLQLLTVDMVDSQIQLYLP
jgi:hypothetical protein